MRTKPLTLDCIAVAQDSNCLHIHISEELDITDLKIKVLGSARNLLATIKPTSRELDFCIYTGMPMFMEVVSPDGVSVSFVTGSGKDFYNVLN